MSGDVKPVEIPPMPRRFRDYYHRAHFLISALTAIVGVISFLLINQLRGRDLLLRADVYTVIGAFLVSVYSLAGPVVRWAEDRAAWKRAHGWNKWWA